ncbi:hypothetical protein ACHQM5_006223 [Ranunculus cassubicifolius]
MATNTLFSVCEVGTNLPHTFGNAKTCSDFHDASFSSYISNAKSISIFDVGEKRQDLTLIDSLQAYQLSSQRITADREISIFSAEKYFNGGMDEENDVANERDEGEKQPMEEEQLRFKPGIRSPSEASWNSQSALLPQDQSQSRKSKMNGRRFFSAFIWKCSCKNSVDIDEPVEEYESSKDSKKEGMDATMQIKMDPINSKGTIQAETKELIPCRSFDRDNLVLRKEEEFVFTVSSSAVPNLAAGNQSEEKENGRKSLEVFESPLLRKGDKAMSLDRRLTMFTWDLNSKGEEIPADSASREFKDDDDGDNESDCSSDLFEINSFSENVHPFFKRQASSDGMSTCLANTCHKLSEASTDSKVDTATAVNIPTVSKHEEQAPNAVIHHHTKAANKINIVPKYVKREEAQRSHHDRSLECKSQIKAEIAVEEYRVPEKAKCDAPRPQRNKVLKTMQQSRIEYVRTNIKSASVHKIP